MTKEFWKAILIRVIKTWCQSFVAVIGVEAKTLGEVNWEYALSVATLAAIVCLVWNIGTGLPEVELPVEVTDADALRAIEESEYLQKELEKLDKVEEGDEEDE